MKSNTTRILLVEDNPGDARLIREMLAEAEGASFGINSVPTTLSGAGEAGPGRIDLVLLDLGLPESRGLDTFVKAYSHAPQIPFVVLTGLDDETVALDRGAGRGPGLSGQGPDGWQPAAPGYPLRHRAQKDRGGIAAGQRGVAPGNRRTRAAEMAVEAERQRLFALLDRLPAMVSLIAPDFSLLSAIASMGNSSEIGKGNTATRQFSAKESPAKAVRRWR